MPTRVPPMALALLVLITGVVVHVAARSAAVARAPSQSAPEKRPLPARGQGDAGLPEPVVRMREAIGEAVRSGDLEDLRIALELNEMKPEIGGGTSGDQLGALRTLSADGTGRDILAAVGRVLEGPWVASPTGADAENNRVFVWPAFADADLRTLPPEDAEALERIAGPEAALAMRQAGRYSRWRLGIGADGTWHYLRR